MTDVTWTIMLVGEGPSDFRRVRTLIDGWVKTRVEWADLPTFRRYCGLDDSNPHLETKRIPAEARALELPPFRGDFSGRGDHRLVGQFRQILRRRSLAQRKDLVVVWSRDEDEGDADGQKAAANARQKALDAGEAPILRAVAKQSGEAWVVLGWEPTDAYQKQKHQEIIDLLGFDPVHHPQALSHKPPGVTPKSSKAILAHLSIDYNEEARCLLRAAACQDERAHATGLSTFRADVWEWLDPQGIP